MHFGTGVLCTSACAGVYVQQVFLQHQRTHLRHTRCRVCIYVCAYICVYACICIWMNLCVYDIACSLEALLLKFSNSVYVCFMHMYMCVHVSVYICMFACMYMYICVSVNMYAYTCIYTRVWVYICARVGTFLVICTVQSLHYMRVYHRCFCSTCMRGEWGLEVGV